MYRGNISSIGRIGARFSGLGIISSIGRIGARFSGRGSISPIGSIGARFSSRCNIRLIVGESGNTVTIGTTGSGRRFTTLDCRTLGVCGAGAWDALRCAA